MKGKILIVGETKDLIDPVSKVFEKDGYVVIMSYSLKEASKAVKDFGPNAVIDVVDSPSEDCLRLCESLRREDPFRELPIIMIARKDVDKRDIIGCLKRGSTDTILRPFQETELLSKVKNLIKAQSLYNELKQDMMDLSALSDVTRAISSSLDSKEILYIIVKKISEIIDVVRCSIVSIDPDGRYGIVVASHENPGIRDIKINLMKYPEIKKALQMKDIVLITDVWKDPLMAKVKRYLKVIKFDSIMVIPLIYREEVIGTLFLRTSRSGATFTEKEIRFCMVVANMAAGALYNAYLYEMIELEKSKLQKLAITDDLTGVYNHRYFTHRLNEEFDRVHRYNHPLSLIMLDIDHFKVINDTYGHRKGDIILKEFAKVLKRNIRKTDILARYGGEEFVLLLPQTDRSGALNEGERIRRTLKKHNYRIRDIRITVSLGIATYPHEVIKNPDDLIGCADKSLYLAKRKGRDSTAVYR